MVDIGRRDSALGEDDLAQTVESTSTVSNAPEEVAKRDSSPRELVGPVLAPTVEVTCGATMNDDVNRTDSIDGRLERAKDVALGAHHSPATHSDEFGEATGGITGVLVGAGIGSAAGPVGTLIGGIAGALSGWWAGRAVAEAASTLTHEDDAYFRAHYDSIEDRPADRAYDDVRGAYYLGHIASGNPEYSGRPFPEVEPELERGWSAYENRYGSWASVRRYVEEGFSRGRSRLDDAARDDAARKDRDSSTPIRDAQGRSE
jgi:hypothetical protein